MSALDGEAEHPGSGALGRALLAGDVGDDAFGERHDEEGPCGGGGEMGGLEVGGVAGEEAAEGEGAVALQPGAQQLHPLIAGSGPVGGELLDDLIGVAGGRHGGEGEGCEAAARPGRRGERRKEEEEERF